MSRWYRAYEGTVSDAKLGEVALVAECSRSVVIAAWHAILEDCAAINEGGRFDTTPRRVAVILCEPVKTLETVFAEMTALGMIADGCVTAWKARQYESDSSTERSRKHREAKRNTNATLLQRSATPPENRDRDIDSSSSEDKSSSEFVGSDEPTSARQDVSEDQGQKPKKARNAYPADFMGFWGGYPKTPIMSKKEAFSVWQKLPEDDRAKAMQALPLFVQYCRDNPDYPVVHACRFLSKRRADGLLESSEPKANAPPPPERQAFDEEMTAKWSKATDELPAETEAAGSGPAVVHWPVRGVPQGGVGLHPVPEDHRSRSLSRDQAGDAGMGLVGNLLPQEIWPGAVGNDRRH